MRSLAKQFDRGLVRSLRNNVLDAAVLVYDRSAEVDAAVERFRAAVQRRDMITRQLQQVLDQSICHVTT